MRLTVLDVITRPAARNDPAAGGTGGTGGTPRKTPRILCPTTVPPARNRRDRTLQPVTDCPTSQTEVGHRWDAEYPAKQGLSHLSHLSHDVDLRLEGDRIWLVGPKGASADLRPTIAAPQIHGTADTARPALDTTCTLVTSPGQLDAVVHVVHQAGRVALGTMPAGCDPVRQRPRLLQLATPDERVFVLDLPAVRDVTTLAQALGEATVIAHDALHDLKILHRHCNVTPHTAYCARTAARLLDGGLHAGPKHDDYFCLDNLYERHLGLHTGRDPQTSDWTGTLTPSQLQSAARDVRDLLRLHDALTIDIQTNGLESVYMLECKLLPVLVDMNMAGVGVNRQRWCDLVSERRAGMLRLKARLLQQLGNVNPDSYPQVKAALHALGCDIDGMSAETLAPYLNRPYVQDLLDYHSVASFVRGPGKEILEILQA
ncbi:MAG: hypothetical protein WBP56_20425, partial [Polyangia bacterium]